MIMIDNEQNIDDDNNYGRLQGGVVHYPPLSEIRGRVPPLYFFKVIIPKAFDRSSMTTDRLQSSWEEWRCTQRGLNFGQQCLTCLYFKQFKKTKLS